MLSAIFFTSLACRTTLVYAAACYPAGPNVPLPTSLSTEPIFNEATRNLTGVLDGIANEKFEVGWMSENVSFSVAVISFDQDDPAIPLWEYHHLAEYLNPGFEVEARDRQWMIGSITKVFTVYLMLRSGINTEKSVVEYLPELKGQKTTRWEDITLSMLAEHLAGVTADYGFSEYYYLKDLFHGFGLPKLNNDNYPACGVLGLNVGCGPEEYIQGVASSYPVTAPNERPAYSNAAFNIMALAMQAFTGKNYTEMMREFVADELGMASTFPSPGENQRGVVPPGESSWGADYGVNAPAGGLVSTISDLSRFCNGLLSRSLAISPAQTSGWLQPRAFTEGLQSSVGMPWEVLRLSGIAKQPVTLYGKSGGAMSYRSQVDIVPELGIAVVVFTAGTMHALPDIRDATVGAILPVVDSVARDRARKEYSRTFASKNHGGDGCQDPDGFAAQAEVTYEGESLVLGSLRLTSKRENRTADLAQAIAEIWNLTVGEYTGIAVGSTVRLFPSGLGGEKLLPGESKPARAEVWRLWPDLSAASSRGSTSAVPGAGLVSGKECMTWSVGDWVHYGKEPIDRVVFYRDGAGRIVALEVPFLRSGVLYVE